MEVVGKAQKAHGQQDDKGPDPHGVGGEQARPPPGDHGQQTEEKPVAGVEYGPARIVVPVLLASGEVVEQVHGKDI